MAASSLMDLPVGDAADTPHLLEAHSLMLQVGTDELRKTRPDLWVYAQDRLGDIERSLAANEDTTGWSCETAIERYRAALSVAASTGDRMYPPTLRQKLGLAMSIHAHQRRDSRLGTDAVQLLLASGDSFDRLGYTEFAVLARNTAATSRGRLAEIKGSSAEMARAADELRRLATPELRKRYPRMWALTQLNLTNSLATLGLSRVRMSPRPSRDQRMQYLSETLTVSRDLLTAINEADDLWPTAQSNLGRACLGLGELERDTTLLDEAVAAFERSLTRIRKEVRPSTWSSIQRDHAAALRLYGVLWHDASFIDRSVGILREVMVTERDPEKKRETAEQIRDAIRLRDSIRE